MKELTIATTADCEHRSAKNGDDLQASLMSDCAKVATSMTWLYCMLGPALPAHSPVLQVCTTIEYQRFRTVLTPNVSGAIYLGLDTSFNMRRTLPDHHKLAIPTAQRTSTPTSSLHQWTYTAVCGKAPPERRRGITKVRLRYRRLQPAIAASGSTPAATEVYANGIGVRCWRYALRWYTVVTQTQLLTVQR